MDFSGDGHSRDVVLETQHLTRVAASGLTSLAATLLMRPRCLSH